MLVQFNIQLIHWLLFLLDKSWNAFIISSSDGYFFKICLLKLFSKDRINFSSFAPSFHAPYLLRPHTSLLQHQEPLRWEISSKSLNKSYLNSFLLHFSLGCEHIQVLWIPCVCVCFLTLKDKTQFVGILYWIGHSSHPLRVNRKKQQVIHHIFKQPPYAGHELPLKGRKKSAYKRLRCRFLHDVSQQDGMRQLNIL